jgi:hypothetical protein
MGEVMATHTGELVLQYHIFNRINQQGKKRNRGYLCPGGGGSQAPGAMPVGGGRSQAREAGAKKYGVRGLEISFLVGFLCVVYTSCLLLYEVRKKTLYYITERIVQTFL